MGVDASIYDRKSKKRYYFDRLYNIQSFNQHPKLGMNMLNECEVIFEKLTWDKVSQRSATNIQVLALVRICEEAWKLGEESASARYHSLACAGIERFVQLVGEGDFFVVTDNEWESHELDMEYEQVKFD